MKYPDYFPLQEFKAKEEDLPFEIITLDDNDTIHEHNTVPHRQNFIEIVWITQGTAVLIADMQRIELQPNHLCCITPGQVHQLRIDDHTRGFVYQFTEEFLFAGEHDFDLMYHSGLFQHLSRSGSVRVEPDIAAEMKEVTGKMIREAAQEYMLRIELMRRYLKIFLIYLTRQLKGRLKATMQTRNQELVEQFKNLVDQEFKTKKKVVDYARQLSVTPNYLNEIVKKISGYPASHHIKQRVVLEAKRQAIYTDICMKEVAWHLGFSDIAHFSKFFKNTTGSNFSDFKKECLVIAAIK